MDASDTYYVYEIIPGKEAVTLRARQPDQVSFLDYNLPFAKQKKKGSTKVINTRELGTSPAIYTAEATTVWQLWQAGLDGALAVYPAALPCPLPKLEDVIVGSDGQGWVVKEILGQLFGNVIECKCLKEVS